MFFQKIVKTGGVVSIPTLSLGISNSNPPLLLYIARPPLKEGGVRDIAHFRLRVSPYRPPSAADPLLKKRGGSSYRGGVRVTDTQ